MRAFSSAVAAATAALMMAGPARADQVVLDNGESIEGKAEEIGDSVRVELDFGSVTLNKSEVREIKRGDTALEELQRRKRALKGDSPAELHALAAWAQQHGLDTKAREIYRRILSVAPNDAKAHQALGDRELDGKWVDEATYMTAKGYLLYGGTWRTKDEVRALEAEAGERRARIAQRDQIARAESEAARLKAEEEERAREEAEYQRLHSTTYWGWWPWRGLWPYGWFGRGLWPIPRDGRGLHRYSAGVPTSPRLNFSPSFGAGAYGRGGGVHIVGRGR